MKIVAVVGSRMKKIIILFSIFLLYTILINSCSIITNWDRSLIIFLQQKLRFIPNIVFLLPDCKLYITMIVLPLLLGGCFLVKQKSWSNLIILLTIPLFSYLVNCFLKNIIQRPRPPYELQKIIHPDSFSYVSSHSLVTFCIWGFIIFLSIKYCKNKWLKIIIITISIIWMLFVGLSRIVLGVHNPSDVLGAYILGTLILITFFITMEKYRHVANRKFQL